MYFSNLTELAQPAVFSRELAEVRRIEWIAYAKLPFGDSKQVLTYLGPTLTASPSPIPD